jgi:hypothetical protein
MVMPALLRLPKGFVCGEDAELVSIFVEDAHLWHADLKIDAQVLNRLHPHDRLYHSLRRPSTGAASVAP